MWHNLQEFYIGVVQWLIISPCTHLFKMNHTSNAQMEWFIWLGYDIVELKAWYHLGPSHDAFIGCKVASKLHNSFNELDGNN
jgi:hypothetical protein